MRPKLGKVCKERRLARLKYRDVSRAFSRDVFTRYHAASTSQGAHPNPPTKENSMESWTFFAFGVASVVTLATALIALAFDRRR